jgi:hypothetical protein
MKHKTAETLFTLTQAIMNPRARKRSKLLIRRLGFMKLLTCLFLVVAASAFADVKNEVLTLTGGTPAKAVWVKDRKILQAFDTKSGEVRDLYTATEKELTWPMISPDGETIFFSVSLKGKNNDGTGTIHSIGWDGTGEKKLLEGYGLSTLWSDPATGQLWVYYSKQQGSDGRSSVIYRFPAQDPTKEELVWDKTDLDAPVSLSADGRFLASQVQWPRCALFTAPNGEVFPAIKEGCNSNILPDNSYRMFHVNFGHTAIHVYNNLFRRNPAEHATIPLDVGGGQVSRARTTNHPRFLTFFGPMGKYPYSDVFFGKFNAEFNKLEGQVRLTSGKQASPQAFYELPYVWLEKVPTADLQFPVGQWSGEAPFSVSFPSHMRGTWDYGDGASGTEPQHTYTKPGEYTVKLGDKTGKVFVTAQEAPQLVSANMIGPLRAMLTFSERIQLKNATGTLASGNSVLKLEVTGDEKELQLDLDKPLAKADSLTLRGVFDCASTPNPLAGAAIPIAPPAWPTSPDGVLLVWTADSSYTLGAAGRYESPELKLSKFAAGKLGFPALDRFGRWALPCGNDGHVPLIDKSTSAPLRAAYEKSGELTIELVFATRQVQQRSEIDKYTDPDGASYLVIVGTSQEGVMVQQLDDTLLLKVAGQPPVQIGKLTDTNTHHLVVTLTPGRVQAWLDGVQTADSTDIQGKANINWSNGVSLGKELKYKPAAWQGWIDAVAIYNRPLAKSEVKANTDAFTKILTERKMPERIVAEVNLLETSKTPTPDQIAPYRNALVINEYEVVSVRQGKLDAKKIRVAEWGLWDTKPAKDKIFSPERFRNQLILLEPFESNPQMERELVFNTLPEDFDAPQFARVEEWINLNPQTKKKGGGK